MPKINTYDTFTIPAAGGVKTFDCSLSKNIYEINCTGGAINLLAGQIITASGTPIRGSEFVFMYAGGVTSNAAVGSVSFMGVNLTDAQALQPLIISAYWNGSIWDVKIILDDNGTKVISGAELVDGSVPNIALTNNTITLAKLANVTRGWIVGGVTGAAPSAIQANASGQILIGDGTDIISRAVTGDITIGSTGVTAIGAGKVTAAMLNFTVATYLEATLTLTSGQIKALNGSPLTIVAGPGSGKYIEAISASAAMTFVSAAYATNTTLQIICESADVAQLQNTSMLISTITKNTKFIDVAAATAGQTQIITGAGLQVKVATGNPATGDSTMVVKVLYRIVTI